MHCQKSVILNVFREYSAIKYAATNAA